MNIRDYLRVLRHHWRLIVSVALIAIGLAAVVTVRTTPLYASSSRLFVSTSDSTSADVYQGGLFSQQRVTSYVDIVKSEEVATRVIDRLNLDVPVSALVGKIEATVKPDSVILDVTVKDPDPEMAQALAAAVSEEFINFVSQLETVPGKTQAPVKVSIVDNADLPTSPVSPQPVRNLGLATVLGLALGVALAIVRNAFDTTVKDAETVTQITDAPLLGSIRFDSNAPKRPLITDLESHAPRVEAFRVLRTNLQFVRIDRPSKVFVVTSSLPGDGKTTTAINLAIAMTQAGQRVCLLEGDLRRPKVSEYLRLEPNVGLTTVLIGRASAAEALQSWGSDGLAVLTSGTIPPNPAELLQSHEMRQVIDELRTRFDVIIIDAPPLLPVTDAALLSAEADGAVLVVRHGTTTRDQLSGAAERLQAVGGRLVGAVMSMTSARGGGDSYGYGYGYGYGYAPEPGRRKADDASDHPPHVKL